MKKRILPGLLLLALLLGPLPAAYADDSTTTFDTAAKDFGANTEIYAVTRTPGASYPSYGAPWEPENGVYHGRVASGGIRPDGRYGLVNGDGLANESAFSFYYTLGDAHGLAYWSYLYGSLTAGDHVFLLNLNFSGESADCVKVLRGGYDASLREDFQYLASLQCPVLLRIGGEVNVWTDAAAPDSYIAAYRHVARLARQYAPNAALVYSPSYSSSYLTDMDSFYPGDSYVDWVGVSLYYNRYAGNGDAKRDAFYGVNAYGDPMLNIQQAVNLSRMHRKPIVVTEGGSAHWDQGADTTAFAAERVEKAYSFLTMVYPEIKCIIYSDTDFGSARRSYRIYDNAPMTAVYNRAVTANPTLLSAVGDTGSFYTPLTEYTGGWTGTVTLSAYSYSAQRLTAAWYVDGVERSSGIDYPFHFTLDAGMLAGGVHTVQVVFSNGETKAYTIHPDGQKEPAYTPSAASPFRDVTTSASWYYTPVIWAVERGVTQGATETIFDPDGTCTRAQAVTFLWRAAGNPEPASRYSPFLDVADRNAYYFKAVLWAYENGITAGTDAAHFSPDGACARAEIVTFLHRMEGLPKVAGSRFRDVTAGAFYYDAVQWAAACGVTSGTSETAFSPDNTCTRAEIVTFLYRNFVAG